MKISVKVGRFRLKEPFTISRSSVTHVEVLEAVIEKDGVIGHGECRPYPRYDETLAGEGAKLRALDGQNFDQAALQKLLPAGAARSALDCALWDWRAKKEGRPVWALAGLEDPQPLEITYTLSLDRPEAMAAAAKAHAARPLLKLKLAGADDLERVCAVHAAAPQAKLILDANEGWSLEDYRHLVPQLKDLGVLLIEQPLHADQDEALRGEARPIPLCADEACHDRHGLERLQGLYDFINIKLDKTGGLSEALALKEDALSRGFGIMVGCMMASSLSMAPAVLVAQGCPVVDLDAPLLLAEDRDPPLKVVGSRLYPADPALWG